MDVPFYMYKEPTPATRNHPAAVQFESTANWPTKYRNNPNYGQLQGIHPPAPIYTANQPAPQSWYYGTQQQAPQPQTGYWANGQFYATAPPSGPSGPTVMQMPGCPATMTAQAAQAAAANAALAAMPQGPAYYVGNPMDYATQQAMMNAQFAQMGIPKPPPTQLAPYKPADGQQFWCKELDGSWTLRTHTDIVMGEVSPGHWERHATSGYYYWVRSLA